MKFINLQTSSALRSETCMVVKTDTLISWVMTPYNLVCGNHGFKVADCLQLQPILKTEALCSSETVYPLTRPHGVILPKTIIGIIQFH